MLLALPWLARADDPAPVTLDEIRQMREERKRPAEIVELIQSRGLAFPLDRENERTLRGLGFGRGNIAQLKAIAPAAGVARESAPQLDPLLGPEYQRYADRVEKIRQKSQTDAIIARAEHVTLVCNKDLAARIMPDVKRLQQLIADRFPAPLGIGPDHRVANIVLFPTRYDYEKWVRALFAVYEEEGMQFLEPEALGRALRTDRFLISGMFMCCLERMTPGETRHAVAYGVGYHYIDAITQGKAPAALATGFGNVAEVMLLGEPSMMLNSGYAERELGKGMFPWALIVKQRFAQNMVPPIADLLQYDTSAMEFPQYAECWGFASLLSGGAKEFSWLVLALRKGEPALSAIEKNYGLTADKLHARWRQYAGQ
jgi:hypothetical protein